LAVVKHVTKAGVISSTYPNMRYAVLYKGDQKVSVHLTITSSDI